MPQMVRVEKGQRIQRMEDALNLASVERRNDWLKRKIEKQEQEIEFLQRKQQLLDDLEYHTQQSEAFDTQPDEPVPDPEPDTFDANPANVTYVQQCSDPQARASIRMLEDHLAKLEAIPPRNAERLAAVEMTTEGLNSAIPRIVRRLEALEANVADHENKLGEVADTFVREIVGTMNSILELHDRRLCDLEKLTRKIMFPSDAVQFDPEQLADLDPETRKVQWVDGVRREGNQK